MQIYIFMTADSYSTPKRQEKSETEQPGIKVGPVVEWFMVLSDSVSSTLICWVSYHSCQM